MRHAEFGARHSHPIRSGEMRLFIILFLVADKVCVRRKSWQNQLNNNQPIFYSPTRPNDTLIAGREMCLVGSLAGCCGLAGSPATTSTRLDAVEIVDLSIVRHSSTLRSSHTCSSSTLCPLMLYPQHTSSKHIPNYTCVVRGVRWTRIV